MPLLEGQRIGRYSILRSIGSGGMGDVYLATDTLIKRQVAIKVIRTDATSDSQQEVSQEAARLFLREARTIAALDHPHILPLLDYGEEGIADTHYAYMVMPFRQEGSLAAWLEQRGYSHPLTVQDVAEVLQQAASALQYAHSHGIVHQDVKPANFLIRYREETPDCPEVLLADFGIAKLMTVTSGPSLAVRGTAAYMAPEQWKGTPLPASDQYALAMMAYQMLTGHLPFLGRLEQVMYAHLHTEPPLVSTRVSHIPKEIDTVLLRAMAKLPEERFPSITAFATAFRQALCPTSSDLYATLPLTEAEARNGVERVICLPGGRKAVVSVPAGAYDGQVIRLEGSGEASYPGGPKGMLILTTAIISAPTEITRPLESGAKSRTNRLHHPSPRKTITLVGLACLLLLLSSSGLFYVFNRARAVASGASTSHVQSATKTAQESNTGVLPSIINPYPPNKGVLALNDPLRDNSHNNQWEEAPPGCQFFGDGYHVSTTVTNYNAFCPAIATNFRNFAYEVQMKILKGDAGGINFRLNTDNATFYDFIIDTTGSYTMTAWTGHNGSGILLHGMLPSSVFHRGLNAPNLLAVVANEDQFTLYMNHSYVDTVTNNMYSQGQIGLEVSSTNKPVEVVFTNARVWKF